MIVQGQKNPALGNQTIENYIQRVTELSQLGHKIPTSEELNQIASELGISEKEIVCAQKQSEAHFIRAQGYCGLNHWDDAIEELQEAVAFNPLNLEMIHLLAQAHFGRWHHKHHPQDERQVKMRIKQCLEIQPNHEPSLALLAKFDRALRNRHYRLTAIASLTCIISGSIIGYLLFNDISLNLFSRRDTKLENLKSELYQTIEQLQQEEKILFHNLVKDLEKKELNNQAKISQLENQIKQLQTQIKGLNEKNKSLENRLKIREKLPGFDLKIENKQQ